MKENESKKTTTNVSMKDISYIKKVVDNFKRDCKTMIYNLSDIYDEHLTINKFCNVSFKFELYGFDSLLMQAEVGTHCKRKNDEDTYNSVADILLETLKNAKTEDNIN